MQQICRTCLATCGELVPIFCNDYYIHNLPTKLLHTISIKVHEDDDLPKLMCKKCIFLVDTMYCFKDQCEMAEIKLKKDLENSHTEEITAPATDYENLDEQHQAIMNRDGTTSSEEDYQIEYISEEARLEVENARRRNRRAKRRHKRGSTIGAKLLESIPSLSKKIRPSNFSESSSHQQDTTGMVTEDTNLSESDDRSSLIVSNGSKIYISRSIGEKHLQHSNTTLERLSFSETKTTHYSGGFSNRKRVGSKRRNDSDFSYGHLSKAPRKVMFEANDSDDGTSRMIEMDENQENIENHFGPMGKNSFMQINIIEDSTSESVRRDEPADRDREKIIGNFEPKTRTAELTNSNAKFSSKMKPQNLMESIVLNMPDICAICSQQFRSYLDVLKHKICTHMNSEQEYYFCPVCHDKFYSSSDLIVHLDGHANIQSFICTVCSTNFYTDETLRKHLVTHVDLVALKCKICPRKFRDMRGLIEHMKAHIPEKNLTCILCNIGFQSKEELQCHVVDQHKIGKQTFMSKKSQATEDTYGSETSETSDIRTREQSGFPCPYCQLRFARQESLRDHVRREHKHVGIQSSRNVSQGPFNTSDDETSHRQQHLQIKQQQHSMNAAQRNLKDDTQQHPKNNVQLHLRKNMEQHPKSNAHQPLKNDGKRFRCRICHEILMSRNAYSEHVKESHPSREVLREFVDPSDEKNNDQPNYFDNCTT